jgi:hypothetical protein
MARTFVTNPLTLRIIQVGGITFNRLIFDAYDYINGVLVRREGASPIPPRDYYYNILTGRRILAGSRRYYELIRANWDIEEDYYLIPPWMEDNVAQEFITGDRRQNLLQRSDNNDNRQHLGYRPQPVTYEQIMATHRDTLANLNISLCRECFYPLNMEDGEYCNDCKK